MSSLKALCLICSAILLTAHLPAIAEQEAPDARIAISHSYGGKVGRPLRNLTIYENGRVEISGERCQGCRWHGPYSQQFDLSVSELQDVKRLFDLAALDQAGQASCKMESAGASETYERFYVSSDSGSRSFQFVRSCTSKELEIVRDRVAQAERILQKAASSGSESE
jgi:hypothetical protein